MRPICLSLFAICQVSTYLASGIPLNPELSVRWDQEIRAIGQRTPPLPRL